MTHALGDKVQKCFGLHTTWKRSKEERYVRKKLDRLMYKESCRNYFDAASIIDINNHMHQGGLAFETALYKKFYLGSTKLSH